MDSPVNFVVPSLMQRSKRDSRLVRAANQSLRLVRDIMLRHPVLRKNVFYILFKRIIMKYIKFSNQLLEAAAFKKIENEDLNNNIVLPTHHLQIIVS